MKFVNCAFYDNYCQYGSGGASEARGLGRWGASRGGPALQDRGHRLGRVLGSEAPSNLVATPQPLQLSVRESDAKSGLGRLVGGPARPDRDVAATWWKWLAKDKCRCGRSMRRFFMTGPSPLLPLIHLHSLHLCRDLVHRLQL